MRKLKHILTVFFLMLFSFPVTSQNLVLNSSFEDTIITPPATGNLIDNICYNWFTPVGHTGNANVFHISSPLLTINNQLAFQIPENRWGFQGTCVGNAYAGMGIYSSNNNAREYISGTLLDTLVNNICYRISFKYSLAEYKSSVTIKNLGIHFSQDTLISNAAPTYTNLLYSPQILFNQWLNNENDWIKIERFYLAEGGEQFFTIGNFQNNVDTDTLFVADRSVIINGERVYSSYIYIDDVVVEEVPLDSLPQINLGADTILCKGEQITFDSMLPNNPIYVWNNLVESTDSSFTIDTTGTYWVEAYNGCSYTTDTIYVEFVEPIVDLGEDILACKREEIILQNQNETTNHPQAEFNWYKETNQLSTNQLINISEEGIYSLTANIGHCTDSDTIIINYHVPETSNLITQQLDTTFCVSGILDAGSSQWNDTYLWNTNEETQQITVTESGTYQVYTENECTEATSHFNVKVESLEEGLNDYNIITPNNDFINDLFTIYEGDSEQYQLQIFNRWGKLVWETTDPTNHWSAEGINDGQYFYFLSFRNCAEEIVEKKGTVEVRR